MTVRARITAAPDEEDLRCRALARQIEQANRGWLVIWSTWRRTFTAFCCFLPNPLILDEPTTERLIAGMRSAERSAYRHNIRELERSGHYP